MRILFYYDNYCGSGSKGGTEVATFRIATALKENEGYEVFNAYRKGEKEENTYPYSNVIKLSRSNSDFVRQLAQFIEKNKIEAVVNMSRFFRHKLLKKSIEESGGENIKLLFMQHFAPGSEIKKSSYSSGLHLLKFDPLNPLYLLRATFYPLLKLPRVLRYRKAYKEVYETSDRLILLSEGYKKAFKEIAEIKDESKLTAIANIYDPSVNGEIFNKTKNVLFLSRLDEIQKRPSLALKIWKEIEKDPALSEWQLDIVGSGHDEKGIKRLSRRLGLKNVVFHGWQNSEEFLKRSSILMMTSEYEGLPLSILEARVHGVVPVVFNSFASLNDIIEDNETGIIVDSFGDINGFREKLSSLMKDEDKRKKLSGKTMKGSGKFSSSSISKVWSEMFNSL